jgi:hypothetical protein
MLTINTIFRPEEEVVEEGKTQNQNETQSKQKNAKRLSVFVPPSKQDESERKKPGHRNSVTGNTISDLMGSPGKVKASTPGRGPDKISELTKKSSKKNNIALK